MEVEFSGELYLWRGPAPHHFVRLPDEVADELAEVAVAVTYGWGMVPVDVVVGGSRWATSLWPKDGGYVLPVRAEVRRAEAIGLGDRVDVRLSVAV